MPDAPIGGAFRRPFREQVAFFRQKMGALVPTRRWDDLTGAAHDQAFMVAGAQKADLLADLAAAVDRALSDGKSLSAFRKDFSAAVERHDWHGWTGEGTRAGEAWRTRTIYRANAMVSYAAGRFAQLTAANWKYWVYLHGGSKHPRPEHLHVFNGLVLPPDHPFWQKFYPPSDWGCSCYVVGCNTLAQARRLGGDPDKTLPDGWDAPDPATGEPAGIGKGWGYAPGASVVAAINAKVATWPAAIAADFLAALPQQLRLALDIPERVRPITHVNELADPELEAVNTYTSSGYARINGGLRKKPPVVEPEAETLTTVLARAELPEPVTVYRGVRGDFARAIAAKRYKPGGRYSEAAFMSTSNRVEVAEKFRSFDPDGVLLIIDVPKGAPALDIYIASHYGPGHDAPEYELLVQRGVRWKVVSWDEERRILHIARPR